LGHLSGISDKNNQIYANSSWFTILLNVINSVYIFGSTWNILKFFFLHIISSAPGLLLGAELYISLWHSVKKFEISVNIDVRILTLESLDTIIKIREELNIRTMWGPLLGHIMIMFFYFYCVSMSTCLKLYKFSQKSQWGPTQWYHIIFRYWGHIRFYILAILGPRLGYFCNVFASIFLK